MNGECNDASWELLMKLSTNQEIFLKILEIGEDSEKEINWEEILNSEKPYLLLYNLQIIDYLIKYNKRSFKSRIIISSSSNSGGTGDIELQNLGESEECKKKLEEDSGSTEIDGRKAKRVVGTHPNEATHAKISKVPNLSLHQVNPITKFVPLANSQSISEADMQSSPIKEAEGDAPDKEPETIKSYPEEKQKQSTIDDFVVTEKIRGINRKEANDKMMKIGKGQEKKRMEMMDTQKSIGTKRITSIRENIENIEEDETEKEKEKERKKKEMIEIQKDRETVFEEKKKELEEKREMLIMKRQKQSTLILQQQTLQREHRLTQQNQYLNHIQHKALNWTNNFIQNHGFQNILRVTTNY